MANDNVTPVGPHATPNRVEAAIAAEPQAILAEVAELAERVEDQRDRIFDAMGIISCAQHATSEEVAPGEPDLHRALKAAYDLLDSVCTELDPAHFEVSHV